VFCGRSFEARPETQVIQEVAIADHPLTHVKTLPMKCGDWMVTHQGIAIDINVVPHLKMLAKSKCVPHLVLLA
jgi:hypothetical protein